MKLKTYRAPSMADALGLVKKDLGKDAVILHTRSVRVGGVLGFGAKTLVEITASDESVPMARQRKAVAAQPGPRAAEPAMPASTVGALGAYKKAAAMGATAPMAQAPTASPDSVEREEAQRLTVSNRRVPAAVPPAPVQATSNQTSVPANTPMRAPLEMQRETAVPTYAGSAAGMGRFGGAVEGATPSQIQRELAEIKLLVNQVLHAAPASGAGAAAGHMPQALFHHYLRLLEAAVSRDVADRIIGAVRDELTPGELGDDSIVRATVLRHIAGMIPVAASVSTTTPPTVAGRGPMVIALVGPTGVGKTTTIAKLAAAYKLRHGKTVGLITSDTYRIAAVDQLRTYAGIIGLPLKVVLTPTEMRAAVASLSHLDVVLIDTAGRSQFNADRIQELQEFLDAAGPSEVHLVLSTTAAESVLMKTAEAFAAVRPSRVILTKLDEAVNFGVLVNVVQRINARLSFVTMGQEVPDHIEPGHADRLARMVLDNRLIGMAGGGGAGGMGQVSAGRGPRVEQAEAEYVASGRGGL